MNPPTSTSSDKHAQDGEVCAFCGGLMVRTGSCYTCPTCGESTGCG